MCTAISLSSGKSFFGRNLDLEYSLGENIVVLPRNFPLRFLKIPELRRHFSIIGTAIFSKDYPLFYDGMNEHGLFGAALNFPENAAYFSEKPGAENVASFEVIPWILASCSNIAEAKAAFEHANILSTDFSKELSATPLHWFFADKTGSIAVEQTKKGLSVYKNPFGVLTNNPPFPFHSENIRGYLNLSPFEPENRFSKKLSLSPYSRGIGAVGLPGDFSSASRFIKAAFAKENSISKSLEEDVSAVFHILDSVAQIKGCVRFPEEKLEKTVYSICADGENGIYYYKTYENSRICAVDMQKENLENDLLVFYPMRTKQDIFRVN